MIFILRDCKWQVGLIISSSACVSTCNMQYEKFFIFLNQSPPVPQSYICIFMTHINLLSWQLAARLVSLSARLPSHVRCSLRSERARALGCQPWPAFLFRMFGGQGIIRRARACRRTRVESRT